MLRLHEIVRRLGARQVELARHLGISKAAVTQWLAHGQWPRRQDPEGLRQAVSAWLAARGATPAERAGWAETVPGAAAAAPVNEEDTAMLLRHTALTAAARNRFQLFRDPFHGEVASHEDLYLTPDARYVREALWQAARHAGFVAVVGESGSGKSMLRRDLHDRIAREGEPVIIIEPYVSAWRTPTSAARPCAPRISPRAWSPPWRRWSAPCAAPRRASARCTGCCARATAPATATYS
jgi:hypothetical protein